MLVVQKPVPAPMEENPLLDSSADCSHFYEVMWDSHIKEQPILVGQLHYDPTSKCLTMINKNTCLQRRCLLLGFTSKKEEGKDRRASIIGQFGMECCVVGVHARRWVGGWVTVLYSCWPTCSSFQHSPSTRHITPT